MRHPATPPWSAATKLVVGIIRPERLEAVQRELAAAQAFRLTVSDVLGAATDAAAPATAAQAYAGGGAGAPTSVRKVKLEVAVNEDFVEPTVRAIVRAGATEQGRGDGKVYVLPLEEAIRIRTGERGPDAI
ncbi:MAG: P-II family nitrogen regulator [Planctomycetota bacterium]|nr:P-II family nitrogen regulator [Planctomycetota bacterium]